MSYLKGRENQATKEDPMKTLSPKRIYPGYYKLGELKIEKFEEGPMKGLWVVSDTNYPWFASEGSLTYKEAKQIAIPWYENYSNCNA